MAERAFPAHPDQLQAIQSFVMEQLREYDCPPRVQFQLEMAVEEIFVNITSYAYNQMEGEAVVRCCVQEDPIRLIIQFEDDGKPFNPLAKEAPDISLPAEERRIGGLGIHIVKKTMDAVNYEYQDGKNILTLKKNI